MNISEELLMTILAYQRNEITEHLIYKKLACVVRDPGNKRVLEKIAGDELRHYQQWRVLTGRDVGPDRFNVWKYFFISRIFGFTFGVKLMEAGEEGAQSNYGQLRGVIPNVEAIIRDENEHETALLQLLDEERLRYVGSVVLGLSDALVELTGVLAGFTLALRDTRLIALTGLITGIAAALSMAASEYLSTKAEESGRSALKAAVYTGIAYFLVVFLLILPYLLWKNVYGCLACVLVAAVIIIAFFNYYISVAKGVPFRKRFLEMTILSFVVAAISFVVGFILRYFLGVES